MEIYLIIISITILGIALSFFYLLMCEKYKQKLEDINESKNQIEYCIICDNELKEGFFGKYCPNCENKKDDDYDQFDWADHKYKEKKEFYC